MRNCRWWGWNINKLIRNLSLHLSSSITCHLGYTHHRNNKSRGVQAKGTEDREAKCGLMWIYWKISAHWLPLFLSLHRPWIADIIPISSAEFSYNKYHFPSNPSSLRAPRLEYQQERSSSNADPHKPVCLLPREPPRRPDRALCRRHRRTTNDWGNPIKNYF